MIAVMATEKLGARWAGASALEAGILFTLAGVRNHSQRTRARERFDHKESGVAGPNGRDRFEVDGERVASAEFVYLAMNKPRGIVTTASDEKGRETVYDCLPENLPWVGPVGRLDKASEGLLLLTNDSEWGARILAPKTHLEKTYHVQVDRVADDELLSAIVRGVSVKGDRLRAQRTRLLRHGAKNSWIEIVLDEGKNRQIRRILEVLGVEVLRLVRVAIGPLELGNLAKGEVRALSLAEKVAVDKAIQRSKA